MDSLLEEQRKINQELMNEMKNMQMQAGFLTIFQSACRPLP
jgi:hypothetical protein